MTVQNINSAKKTALSKTVKKTAQNDKKTTIEFTSSPSKQTVKTPHISDTVKGIIDDITKSLGLKFYSKELIKDPQSMIKKSQEHLLGLIKYYEGDSDNCWEGKTGVYNDKYGKKTKGFGCTKKLVSIKTQEQAYEQLKKDLKDAREFAKNKINNRVGKGTFEKLPLSIQEGIIDLSFNKGPDKVVKPDLLNAIKTNDYSAIVGNLYYVFSGEQKNGTEEDPGLYRRSLSRAILASRDLTGKEKTEADKEIDKLYNKAKKCFSKNNISTKDIDNIYSYFKTKTFETSDKTASETKTGINRELTTGSYKFKVDSTFKGKGAYAVAKANYVKQDTDKMSFTEFYKLFNEMNSKETLENIKVGDTVKVPHITGGKLPAQASDSAEYTDSIYQSQTPAGKSNKDGSFIGNIVSGIIGGATGILTGIIKKAPKRIKNGLIGVGMLVGLGIYNIVKLFKKNKKEDNFDFNDPHATPFQKMYHEKDIKITEDSHTYKTKDGKEEEIKIQTLEKEYVVQPKETVWGISKKFGMSRKELGEYNNLQLSVKDSIEGYHDIKIDQKLTIKRIGYKVEKGDTYYSISKKFGITPDLLMDANNITEDEITSLEVGTMLELPGYVYKVKKGDTVSNIAEKTGMSEEMLVKVNGILGSFIKPGDELKIITDKSPDQKIVSTEVVDGKKVEKANVAMSPDLKKRPHLQTKYIVNGKVVATRAVFEDKSVKNGKLSGKTIVLDAGHGYGLSGTDAGAVAPGIDAEWLLNYDNTMRLKDKLVKQGAKVIYLQGKKGLIENAMKEKQNRADLFISIHANSAGASAKDRTQIYYREAGVSGNAKNRSIEFARISASNFNKAFPQNEFIQHNKPVYAEALKGQDGENNGKKIKEARTGLLRFVINNTKIPSVIWEVGFMSNPTGRRRLKDPALMDKYADIMNQSVIQYFDNQNKSSKNIKRELH